MFPRLHAAAPGQPQIRRGERSFHGEISRISVAADCLARSPEQRCRHATKMPRRFARSHRSLPDTLKFIPPRNGLWQGFARPRQLSQGNVRYAQQQAEAAAINALLPYDDDSDKRKKRLVCPARLNIIHTLLKLKLVIDRPIEQFSPNPLEIDGLQILSATRCRRAACEIIVVPWQCAGSRLAASCRRS